MTANAQQLGCDKLVPALAAAYTLAKTAGGFGRRAGALMVGGCMLPCSTGPLQPQPTTPLLPPLHPPGVEAAFVATLSANTGLVAVLRACLTPAQLAYGATLPAANPAAQVSSGMGCAWVFGQGLEGHTVASC